VVAVVEPHMHQDLQLLVALEGQVVVAVEDLVVLVVLETHLQ
jgi:hypothetical protein